MQINSFEDLAKYLREFHTWQDTGGYDFTGMVYLLGSCLDNLRKYASKEEVEEIKDILEVHQIAFLNRIVDKTSENNLF